MGLLITVAVLSIIAVVPVMVGARLLKAQNTGFFSCLLAVVLSMLGTMVLANYIENDGLNFILSIPLSALIYGFILGASFIQALFIALVSIVIQFVGLLILASIGYMTI
jgi:hypothetical protein